MRSPSSLTIRECRVRVEQPGFRIETLIVATTLLDADEFTKDDLAQLYRARWNAELDLRSLKQTLQMDVLAVQNAGAGAEGDLDAHPGLQSHPHDHRPSRDKARHRTANDQLQGSGPNAGSLPASDCHPRPTRLGIPHKLYQQLLDAIAVHRVADRPDRYEPRLRKRRPKHYGFLRKPRRDIKRDMVKRLYGELSAIRHIARCNILRSSMWEQLQQTRIPRTTSMVPLPEQPRADLPQICVNPDGQPLYVTVFVLQTTCVTEWFVG